MLYPEGSCNVLDKVCYLIDGLSKHFFTFLEIGKYTDDSKAVVPIDLHRARMLVDVNEIIERN